jgi:hypothetical protein
MNSTAVIMVNYNTTREVTNCLNSINNHLSDISLEIIVIDNNSQDKPLPNIPSTNQDVKFYFLKENLGFAKANNYAETLSDAEYLLFLNPDTLLIEDFISPIIDFIKDNPEVGACGPMLLYKDFRFQNSFGNSWGLFYEVAEAFMLINIFRKFGKFILKKKLIAKIPFEVGWVSGACLLIKREVFEKVNGFNKDYFLNYEDIDLCTKLVDAGYKNYYFPNLKCIHQALASQSENYENLVLDRYKSRLIFSNLHYSLLIKYLVRIIHVLGLMLRLFILFFYKPTTEFKQRWIGYKKSVYLYIGFKSC